MTSKSVKLSKDSNSHHARVFLRCRPLVQGEQQCHSELNFVGEKEISVLDGESRKHTYHFDRVFGPTQKQIEVYRSVVETYISDVLAGFNCSVLAYGQAGTGKTFTMEGDLEADASSVFDPESKAGLIPHTMSGLLDELNKLHIEFSMHISFLMLHNEEIYDLLSIDETPSKLRLFDDAAKKRGVIIQGIQEKIVYKYCHALEELKKGSQKRQALATLMNMNSSQCHTIFSVTVYTLESCPDGNDMLKTGKLCLVDLAASESIARSGSTDKRTREAGNNNQSILALKRVITGLVEHQSHIPYRESKLTRILQDSLGGRTKTSIIATISPALPNLEDILSTLDYAHGAKRLLSHPETNQKMSKTALNKEYTHVINELKQKLKLNQKLKGFYISTENYQKLKLDIEEQQTILSTKAAEINAYATEIKKLQEKFEVLAENIDKNTEQLEDGVKVLEETIEKVGVASTELAEVGNVNKEVKELLDIVTKCDEKVKAQATEVISIAVKTCHDTEKIHDKLERCKAVVQINNNNLDCFKEQLYHIKNSVLRECEDFVTVFSHLDDLPAKLEEELKLSSGESDAVMVFLCTICEKILNCFKSFETTCDEAMVFYQNWETEMQMHVNEHWHNVMQMLSSGQTNLKGMCTSFRDGITSLHHSIEVACEHVKEESEKKEHLFISALQPMTSTHSETFNCFQATAAQNVQEYSNKVSTNEKNFVEMCTSSKQEVRELQTDISTLLLKWEEIAEKEVSNEVEHEEMFMDEQDFFKNSVLATLCKLESNPQMTDKYQNDCINYHVSASTHIRNPDMSQLLELAKEAKVTVDKLTDTKKQKLAWEELSSHLKDLQHLHVQNSRSFFKKMAENLLEIITNVNTLCGSSKSKEELLDQHVLNLVHDVCHITQCCYTHSSRAAAEIKKEQCEAIHMFQEFIHNAIVDLLPTGQTPKQEECKPLPKLDSLSSPISRKIADRVKNIAAKFDHIVCNPKILLHRRTKKASDRVNESDDSISSDSEVTSEKKCTSASLTKAQSLPNLLSLSH